MAHTPADERREQLLAAAVRVMSRDGVARTTTRAIAAEAGAPLAMVHYCFRTKADLFSEVTTHLIAELLGAVQLVVVPGTPFIQTARAGIRALWQVVVADTEKQMALYELTQFALRNPGLAPIAAEQYIGYERATADFLQQALDAAGAEAKIPLALLARWTVSTVDGVMLQYTVDRDAETAIAVLDAFTEALGAQVRGGTKS